VTLSILLICVSLLLLTGGAELLVRGGVRIALRLGLSSFFIGLTLVGFGTSAPELATGLSAALSGRGDINVGNAIGSNIFNIAFILGLTALVCPVPVRTESVRRAALIVILVALIPLGAGALFGAIPRMLGGAMFALLVVYVWRGYVEARRESPQIATEVRAEVKVESGAGHGGGFAQSFGWCLLLVATGLVFLVVGSGLLVESASDVARALGVSDMVIALTIVAGGTSAPELVTSLVAAARRQADLSVGNILGSNIYNVLMIMGFTSLIRPQRIGMQTLALDGPVMVAASIACLPIMLTGRRISRLEGVFLLSAYVAYVIVLFTLAPGWFSGAAEPAIS